MVTRRTLTEEAARLATRTRRQLGEEIRTARVAAGLSQHDAATAVAMSHAQLGRIERGELEALTLEQVCRAGIAVGLRLGARLYPDGDPVRDRAQLALLGRLRERLPSAATWQTEVPLPMTGDRRAWDAVIGLAHRRAGCEAETRVTDVQALERRLALKLRDGDVDVLILLVSDTRANRAAVALHREDVRALLPLDGREVLGALGRGRLPDAGGLLML